MQNADWTALAELQFFLYNRTMDALNTALSSLALSDMPEVQEKSPGFWKDRASTYIANVINMYTAWSYLVRFKMGEPVPERALRPFSINTLLDWLAKQLQLNPAPTVPGDLMLRGNQESLQEAVWQLYSAAYTQGSNVRFEMEASKVGAWFRVRFSRSAPVPASLDSLLTSFGQHWRSRDTAFELETARDFVRLNGSELLLNAGDGYGEFAFFVRSASAHKKGTGPLSAQPAASAPSAPPAAPAPLPPLAAVSRLGPVTPPVVIRIDEAATPLVGMEGIEAQFVPVLPPTLSILRPLVLRPGAVPVPLPPAAESTAPPVEPQAPPADPDDTPPAGTLVSPTADTAAAKRKTQSHQPVELPAPGTVIVPVKIPAPTPPEWLGQPTTARATQELQPPTPEADSAPESPAAPPVPGAETPGPEPKGSP